MEDREIPDGTNQVLSQEYADGGTKGFRRLFTQEAVYVSSINTIETDGTISERMRRCVV